MMTQALINEGANVNIPNGNGQTAVTFAASEASISILKLVVGNSGDINHLCQKKETPLSWAAYEGRQDCVAYLLKKGAQVNVLIKEAKTNGCKKNLEFLQKIAKEQLSCHSSSNGGTSSNSIIDLTTASKSNINPTTSSETKFSDNDNEINNVEKIQKSIGSNNTYKTTATARERSDSKSINNSKIIREDGTTSTTTTTTTTTSNLAKNNGCIKACSYLQKFETKQKKRKNNDEGNHRNNKKQKVYKIRLNTSPKNAREVVMAYREV